MSTPGTVSVSRPEPDRQEGSPAQIKHPDFIAIPYGIFTDPTLTPTEKLALGRLRLYAGKNGRCNPSHETLARELCLSDARVARRLLSSLKRKGKITWRRTGGSNAYSLLNVELDGTSTADPIGHLGPIGPDVAVLSDRTSRSYRKEDRKEDLKESSSCVTQKSEPVEETTTSPYRKKTKTEPERKPVAASSEVSKINPRTEPSDEIQVREILKAHFGQAPDTKMIRRVLQNGTPVELKLALRNMPRGDTWGLYWTALPDRMVAVRQHAIDEEKEAARVAATGKRLQEEHAARCNGVRFRSIEQTHAGKKYNILLGEACSCSKGMGMTDAAIDQAIEVEARRLEEHLGGAWITAAQAEALDPTACAAPKLPKTAAGMVDGMQTPADILDSMGGIEGFLNREPEAPRPDRPTRKYEPTPEPQYRVYRRGIEAA